MLVGGHVSPPSHLSQTWYSSSNIPCSDIFDHLRTLLIFYSSHNHLTPSHKTPSPIFPEELPRPFFWFLTFSALEYPWCLCPPVQPPWLAA